MSDYKQYQKSLGEIPKFINKYLTLDCVKRLKDISLFCGMDYASPYMYDFKYPISRYDHSLNVALITWNLTHNKSETLAALFHDISTPVFSHVIDYMNGDYITQESTEDKTKEVLYSSKRLLLYLQDDGVDINDIINFKDFSIVDLPRPSLCADRLENIIGVGMSWAKLMSIKEANDILSSITTSYNEDGKLEISLTKKEVRDYVVYINSEINKLTHSGEDTYMMMLLADVVKKTISDNLIDYNDLYYLTEHQYMNIIESNLDNYELSDLWEMFKTVRKPILTPNVKIKELTLNPLVNGERINR